MPNLPSGLKVYISNLSIVDFQGTTEWFSCPRGHFWFMTPNLTMSAPPYLPTSEVVFDFLSAPVPKSRSEAMQFVHVYLEDVEEGIYWRGDWLDTFAETYPLSPVDTEYWDRWLTKNGDFFDKTIMSCEAQAVHNRRLSGSYRGFPGEYMIHMTQAATSVGKEIVPSRIKPYSLSQLMARKHRIPDSVKQTDYEMALGYVARDLQNQGYEVTSASKSYKESPSLIAELHNAKIAVQIVVARAPDDAIFAQSDIVRLKRSSPAGIHAYGFAAIGLLPTTPRSADGCPGFYIKFDGIVNV